MSLAIDNVDVVEVGVEEDVVLAKTTRAQHVVSCLANRVKFNLCQYLFYERMATPSELTSCCDGVHPNAHLQTLMSCGIVDFIYVRGGEKNYRLTPYGNSVLSTLLEFGVGSHTTLSADTPNDDSTVITGATVREYRHSHNITQKQLAALLGYSAQNIGVVERATYKKVSTRFANKFRTVVSNYNIDSNND